MKKLYILLLSAVASVSFGQTIYSENMGIPTSTTLITSYITGAAPATFQNGAPIVYSGTGDVRVTSASSTYSGASGGGNVYLTSTAGKYFQIDGINTSAYSSANIQMTFGYLTATFATVQVILEYSTDASATTPTWTPISFTNNPSASWALVAIPGGVLPASNSLSLRFTQPAVAGQIRIDDIKIFNFNPACTLALGTPTGVCDNVTFGIDTYTATIPFTGGGTAGHIITPSAGTVAGDNPDTVAAGNILINGVPEGTVLTVNVVNGVCPYSATLSAPPVCKPVNTLPYVEPFPYTVGSAIGSSQKWTNLNTGDDILTAAGSLTYTGYPSSGNSATFTGAGIDCFTPFTSTTSGTIFASFLVNVTDLSTMTSTTPTTYFAGLTDAAKNYKGRLFITKSGTQYQFGLDAASTTTNLDTTLRNAGDIQLVIMSYDFTTLTLKAWINPTVGFDPTTTTPTLSQVLTTAIADLGGFILRQDTATTTPTIIFDELRIDTTIGGLLTANQTNEIAGLKVYPNPVSNGTMFIESDSNAERTVAVFDVLGKQVLNTTTSTNAINVSQLNTGVYIVRITEEGKIATKKLVIR